MFGAQPLAQGGAVFSAGSPRHAVRRAHHKITSEGVQLVLPDGPVLSDSEARRLAWAILADLAPDEVDAMPEAVTYKEAQRLAVLRALKEGVDSIIPLAQAMGWHRRTVERRLGELIKDGRAQASGHSSTRRFQVAIEGVL
jgi:hypothetical protein